MSIIPVPRLVIVLFFLAAGFARTDAAVAQTASPSGQDLLNTATTSLNAATQSNDDANKVASQAQYMVLNATVPTAATASAKKANSDAQAALAAANDAQAAAVKMNKQLTAASDISALKSNATAQAANASYQLANNNAQRDNLKNLSSANAADQSNNASEQATNATSQTANKAAQTGTDASGGGKNSNCSVRSSTQTSWCVVTGVFAIPFRAELTGKKDVLGGVSADFFVGININPNGSLLPASFKPTFLVYAGYLPSLSSTSSSSSGQSSSGTGALDFGIGLAFPVDLGIMPSSNQTAHFGLAFGFDQTSSSNKYAYNGKPYISAFYALSF